MDDGAVPVIGVRLSGGLGNQLFQYAAGRALALDLDTRLVLDASAFGRARRGETPRAFELAPFGVRGQVSVGGRLGLAGRLRRAPWLAPWLSGWRLFVEHDLTYNDAVSSVRDGTLLVGYWQSFHYFQRHAAAIAGELAPVRDVSAASRRVADLIDALPSVAVHVRRGDYVTLQAAAALHGLLPLEYYRGALDFVRSRVQQPTWFVFSDDPQWCREHLLPAGETIVVVDHNPGHDAWQDLWLMGRCRHHVIANSSFSWWGAWLADQHRAGQPRVVVAPAQWFAGQQHDTRDRFPPHWTTLSWTR